MNLWTLWTWTWIINRVVIFRPYQIQKRLYKSPNTALSNNKNGAIKIVKSGRNLSILQYIFDDTIYLNNNIYSFIQNCHFHKDKWTFSVVKTFLKIFFIFLFFENLKKLNFCFKMMGIMLFPAKNMPFPALSGSNRSIWPFSGSIE
jgi:hypothetical protein